MNKVIHLISILALILAGCKSDPANQYKYHPPEKIKDGLDVGLLDEVNIETTLIEKAVNKIYRDKNNEVHSILIFKDNNS